MFPTTPTSAESIACSKPGNSAEPTLPTSVNKPKSIGSSKPGSSAKPTPYKKPAAAVVDTEDEKLQVSKDIRDSLMLLAASAAKMAVAFEKIAAAKAAKYLKEE